MIPPRLPLLRLAATASLVTLTATLAIAQAPPASPRRDPTSAQNIGRTNLVEHLDAIAAKDAAARRDVIAGIQTRAQAEARQAKVRATVLQLLGGLPQERTPLDAKVLGTTEADGFRIEKVLFDSQPGFHVTGLLYLPSGRPARQKLPAVLMTPGHSPAGKAGDYATAAAFARNGFVVLSYDPIGQGERLQYPDPAHPDASLASRPTGEHGEAGLQPTLIGDAVTRYFIWDAMRAIDYLESRPEVDSKRIGAFGCSGGGTITALTVSLEPRIAAVGVACFTTSFDALLPSIGPQDGEQSIPHFIASGLDFPDWIELVAPRPYAVVATYSDMFPFAGARTTVQEARRFYALFDPASAGTGTDGVPPTPTEPALNADTTKSIPPTARLQFITGPGGHGALTPIMGNIIGFFIRNLQPGADPDHPILPPPRPPRVAGAPITPPSTGLPKDALQVTPTGQIASSYPGSATVFSLNKARAAKVIPANRPVLSGEKLAAVVRETTPMRSTPGQFKPAAALLSAQSGSFTLTSEPTLDLQGDLAVPTTPGRHPAVILLVPNSIHGSDPIAQANKAKFDALAAAGNLVYAVTPRPSPPGTDDMKSPILGPFYLLSLRAELVGRSVLGLRTDDVFHITDYLAARADVDPAKITAEGSGHMGLVLMNAALLDPRLKHVTVDHVLTSYRSLVDAPLPTGAPEDIVPGVLLRYDIPDIVKSLGSRLTSTSPLTGTDDLSQTSTPVATLTNTNTP